MKKAIIFDLWNTLAYNDGPNPFLELKQRFQISDMKLIENAVMKQEFETEKDLMQAFCTFFRIDSYEILLGEMVARFKAGLAVAHLFDDVIPALRELKKKYRLCLISNTDQFSAQALRKSGLFDYIEVQCLSCDVGLIKPDRAIFELMLEKLDLNPGECVMVGDNITDDIMPATELGMSAILIKRDPKYPKSHIESGIFPSTITSLSELKKYL